MVYCPNNLMMLMSLHQTVAAEVCRCSHQQLRCPAAAGPLGLPRPAALPPHRQVPLAARPCSQAAPGSAPACSLHLPRVPVYKQQASRLLSATEDTWGRST